MTLTVLSKSRSVGSNSLRLHRLCSAWHSPGYNTGVDKLFPSPVDLPDPGIEPGLLHCRRILYQLSYEGSPVVKNPPANAGDIRDASSIPGSERSPGGGNGHALQYPCLENLMNTGAWRATVHGVAKSQDTTERLSTAQLLTSDPQLRKPVLS